VGKYKLNKMIFLQIIFCIVAWEIIKIVLVSINDPWRHFNRPDLYPWWDFESYFWTRIKKEKKETIC
jgi:hypothetical protein